MHKIFLLIVRFVAVATRIPKTTIQNKTFFKPFPTMSKIIEKLVESSDCSNNLVSDKNVKARPQAIAVETSDH